MMQTLLAGLRSARRGAAASAAASVLLVTVALGLSPAVARALELAETRLANGLRVVYGESHASGLVASAVLVGAGAARETAGMNGAAHFLEHLLFNGTAKRTQEELYRDTDLLGAYSNATTRRDHVAYLMVVAGEDLDPALEIQADMLLHSTLPADKFEKERGIIIEEMGKDAANPDRRAAEALDRLLAPGTADALPILGTIESIQAMRREDVLDYYRTYYVPSNMTLLVLGDIAPAALLAAVERHFGGEAAGSASAPAPAPRPSGIFVEPAALEQVHLRMSLPGPAPADSAFAALRVLEDLLAGESGRLALAIEAAPRLAVSELGASVRVGPGRSSLEIEAVFDSTTSYEAVVARLLGSVAALAAAPVPAAELALARTQREVGAALAAEQIHYFAFTLADLLLHAPLGVVSGAGLALARVDAAQVERVASALLTAGGGAALAAIGPGLAPRSETRDPRDLAAPAAGRPAPPSSSENYEVTQEMAERAARLGPVTPPRTRTPHAPATVVLDNGLTMVLAANPDSDVFAVHVAARGRSYCEPAGRSGLADLLHRMLLLGAGPWAEGELTREIERAGLQIKVTDSPGIPYDDYQTTPDFSFVRLETADRFYREALVVLGEMIFAPALGEAALAAAQKEAIPLAERRARSASEESQQLLRRGFYPGSRGAWPPLGTATDLARVTVDDVRAFHERYFAPANLVVAIVTGLEPRAVEAAARAAFERPAPGRAPGGRGTACVTAAELVPAATAAPAREEATIGREQSWIRVGSVFPVAPGDGPALEVASLVLSDRLAFELRERQGLAYAIGAHYGQRGDRGWIAAGMGTRPENLPRAEAGLDAGIHGLAATEVTAEEVTKVVKTHIGRLRMRRVSRINQAMNLGLDALWAPPGAGPGAVAGGGGAAGNGAGGAGSASSGLTSVTAADVRRVAAAYLAPAPLITAVAR
jgi:predicted Zn-dependent peptidase